MKQCRICDNPISSLLSFGQMPLANAFLEKKDFSNEYFFELAPAYCNSCKMLQLIEQPNPEMMFHENYAFFSGTSQKMAKHFETAATHYINEFIPSRENAFVIELGSNDGILLKHFAKKNIAHLGIEPSNNVADVARKQGINTISDYFGETLACNIAEKYGKADLISSANVMCHIPDLNSVAKGISHLLKPTGVLAFEDPYLGAMISKTSYDQLYDEHVFIFSAHSVQNAFARHGLELFHVEPLETHGGSMRYYLSHKGAHQIRNSVKQQLEYERKLNLDNPTGFANFKNACEKNQSDFVKLLQQLKSQGKRVVGYAATSKSTTVLNYCKIGPDLIEYICDTTPIKQNKYSPGMHIPIKPYETFQNDYPDYAVLFAWNHAKEIIEKEKTFIKNGGQWIIFVPIVKIIEAIPEFSSFAMAD